ncbi:MAG: glycosyltransferase [bacterium]
MKVLQINKFFYEESGVTRYLFGVKELLDSSGHDSLEFAMAHPKNVASPCSPYFVDYIDYNQPGGLFSKIKIGLRLIYSFSARRKLEKLILATKPDIAHLHVIYHQLTPSILGVLKKHKIPIVQTLHDYKQICPNYLLYVNGRICERCKKHRYYNVFFHRCIKKSFIRSLNGLVETYLHWFLRSYSQIDLYLAPSQFIRKKYIEFGVSPEKIKYLPHFLNLEEYNLAGSTGNYLAYVGRLSQEKGVSLILTALVKAGSDIPLKIIGDGPEKDNLRAMIKKLGLKKSRIDWF